MKPKVHRGPKMNTKRRGLRQQGPPPLVHPLRYPYAQPYPLHVYAYSHPSFQYSYLQPPVHGISPTVLPNSEKRQTYDYGSQSSPLLPPGRGPDTSQEPTKSDPHPDQDSTTPSLQVDIVGAYTNQDNDDEKKPASESPAAESDGNESSTSDTENDNFRETSVGEGKIIPHGNDVLMGRGGNNNTHIGNARLREMARQMREVYIRSRKKHKTELALQLVQQVFALNPPGRFLQRDPKTMVWEEVCLEVARHKTSQCLRDAASEKPSAVQRLLPLPHLYPSYPPMGGFPGVCPRATTPVRSNMANKIEPSPQPFPQEVVDESNQEPSKRYLGKWEPDSGALASTLVKCWDNKDDEGASNTPFASLDPVPVKEIWESISKPSNVVEYLEVEDANMIPPEELDAVAEGLDSFSLFPERELEVETHHDTKAYFEHNPFDSEFF